MPIVPTKRTKAERYTNPITGEQRYFEVNRVSHRVTDQQLKRSVRRVYGNNRPSKADRGVAARTVYPAHPNAKQLRNWEKNPGRVDIKGIDAPRNAVVTARHTVTIPRNVQRQIGVRSANAKSNLSIGEKAAIDRNWAEYKYRHGGKATPGMAYKFAEDYSDIHPELDLDELYAVYTYVYAKEGF